VEVGDSNIGDPDSVRDGLMCVCAFVFNKVQKVKKIK
jgi:hypothetical protein